MRMRRRKRRRRGANRREKAKRAYRAYVDLLETAEWFRELAERHLRAFNLTVAEYRLMERIFRRGPQYQMQLSRRFACSKQNVGWLITRLESIGWVRRVAERLPARRRVQEGWVTVEKAWRGEGAHGRAAGRRISRVFLTEKGREVIDEAVRKHAKYVKAEMRALDAREQRTLSEMCRKLQEGDPEGFFMEITRCDWEGEQGESTVES